MAEKKTIQDRIRESNLSAFSSIGSPLPGTGVRYDMDNQSTLTPAQTAYLASVFAPGAGVTDATGNFPEFPGPDVALVDAFSGDPMPSMAENIAAGGIDRYLFAPLQGLGVLGDAAYGVPFAGPVIAGGLKAPAAIATLVGGIAKASKGSKAAKKGVGSLDQPKDMMFVHNTNESAIKSFDQMGGIPSPSLAVQPADVPLKGFGQIQLIAKPKNFDPAVDPRNAVYSADAYTPRAPKKIRLAKEGAAEQLAKEYKNIANKYTRRDKGPNDMFEQGQYALRNLEKDNLFYPENRMDEIERFFDSNIAKIKFLEDTGRNVDDYLEGPKSLGIVDFQARAAALNPNSALYQSATKADEFKLTREFRDWVAKEKDKYLSQEGVFQYFDDFEQTMVTKPYTLENATRNMIEETQRGGEGGVMGMYGPNRLRALMSEKMTDLEDIKSQRSRIEDNPPFFGLGENIDEVLESAIDEANRFDAIPLEDLLDEGDNFINQIGNELEAGKNIEDAVKSAISYFDVEPPAGLTDKIVNVFKKNAARNVEYLEAKPMRSVGFEEFAGAIVPPRTSQEVIDILEKRGLKVIKNDPETDFMKTKARQKFKDQMFSFAPVAGAGGIAALSIEDNTPDNDKGVGSIKN